MKNLKFIAFLMLIASCILFIKCTSEPIDGIPGIAGADGINGIDGTNGVDGTASCVACHSESNRTPIDASFAKSGHANQTIMYDGSTLAVYAGLGASRASCNKCHTNEGYINYITGEPAVALTNPTAISCTTCHSKHSTFDFKNDGDDYALRNFSPVVLDESDISYIIDYGNASNNCVTCHQPRGKAPIDDDNDGLYLQANSRFYPHYGGQSTMLEGIQGAIIANGATAMPVVGSHPHRTGASCTSCHMGAKSTDNTKGLHSFNVNMANCNIKCHTSGVPTEVAGLAADMTALHNKLVTLGLIKEDGSTIVQTQKIPFKQAQALWNYKTVEEDHSHGVHNPAYAKALIKNALQVVN